MVIRVLSEATVVANAVTAARAAAPESVTVAEAVTATCPARGSDVPPVAERVTVPPAAGMYTVTVSYTHLRAHET